MADFMEWHFRPESSLDQLKVTVARELARLPPKVQANFYLTISDGSRLICGDGITYKIAKLSLRYKTRWLITISEPSDRQFHAERRSKNLH
jgi:hypothetical protein